MKSGIKKSILIIVLGVLLPLWVLSRDSVPLTAKIISICAIALVVIGATISIVLLIKAKRK